MENINYKIEESNPTVVSNADDFEIALYKDKYFFMVFDNYVKFIKSCESLIRKSDDYSKYVAHLKEMGLTRCQVLGNVDSNMSEKGHPVSVEMHHGPIFTLFDYCGAVIMHMLKNNIPITTPRVAKIIMAEHWAGNIQTVMLSSTVHAAVDSGKVFISLKQAHGNLNAFLVKYMDGLTEDNINKINKYIRMSEAHQSSDGGLFELQESMHDWSTRRRI